MLHSYVWIIDVLVFPMTVLSFTSHLFPDIINDWVQTCLAFPGLFSRSNFGLYYPFLAYFSCIVNSSVFLIKLA